ncbi:MAG: TonB-dependent receptor plug domain-containing protein, partial [Gemmatimonadota bacterium]|nr:TonB-dependent receptor plug domain-containing protein [Gemmatimonadota bacterium]
GTDGTPTRVFVDGVEATGAELSEIRRDQIDRVEILKGAAAVAVYGESARGGVIQITKKKNN